MLFLFYFLIQKVRLESLMSNFSFPSLRLEHLETSNANTTEYILKGDLNYTSLGFLTIPIGAGEPLQNFTLFLDLSDGLMFLPQTNAVCYTPITNFFDRSKSAFVDSEKEVRVKKNLGDCLGTIVSSSFWLLNVNVTYYWILCKQIQMYSYPGAEGYIGFNRDINKDSSTILSTLLYSYEKDLPHKVMSIRPPTLDYFAFQLFIGNIHPEFKSTSVPMASQSLINATGPSYFWEISNISFVFGTYAYPFNITNKTLINTTLEFATYTAQSMFPYEFIDAFLKYFPQDCHKEFFIEYTYFINCPNKNLVANVWLHLNKSLVLMPMLRFWKKNETSGEDIFTIVFHQLLNKIVLGVDFFWNYHVLFNHESNSVTLLPLMYGRITDLDYSSPDNDSNFWLVFGIVLGFVVFCIVIGAVVILKRRNKRKPFLSYNLHEYEIGSI